MPWLCSSANKVLKVQTNVFCCCLIVNYGVALHRTSYTIVFIVPCARHGIFWGLSFGPGISWVLLEVLGIVLQISSERDDRRIFWGLKLSISGFFGVGKFWQVFFWVAWFIAKFVVSRCALQTSNGFFCSVNHLSGDEVSVNHNATHSPSLAQELGPQKQN